MKINLLHTAVLLFVLVVISCSKKEEDSTPSVPKPPVTANCFDLDTSYTLQLPNMDFESWGSPDTANGAYQEPCGGVWSSSNAVSIEFLSKSTSLPSSDAQNGSFALQVLTLGVFDPIVIPGILFTGRYKSYDFSNFDIKKNTEFGVPFQEKPKSLDGFYKYTSVGGDSAAALVLLTHYNTSNKVQDTIGLGELTIFSSTSSYTAFSIPIKYTFTNSNSIPDSVLVLFSSSKGALELKGQIGSKLMVDNCSFVY